MPHASDDWINGRIVAECVSRCPRCWERVPSRLETFDTGVVLVRSCPVHGSSVDYVFDDARLWSRLASGPEADHRTAFIDLDAAASVQAARESVDRALAHGADRALPVTIGYRLSLAGYAESLREAGIGEVGLKFDSLFNSIHRFYSDMNLNQVLLDALAACERTGLRVTLVANIAACVNDDEVGSLLEFALTWMPTVQGVVFIPYPYARYQRNQPEAYRYRETMGDVIHAICAHFDQAITPQDFASGRVGAVPVSAAVALVADEAGALRGPAYQPRHRPALLAKPMRPVRLCAAQTVAQAYAAAQTARAQGADALVVETFMPFDRFLWLEEAQEHPALLQQVGDRLVSLWEEQLLDDADIAIAPRRPRWPLVG